MHDDELDTLLLQARPEPTALAARSARELAASIADQHLSGAPAERKRRWSRMLPAVGLGAIVLTAAGSLTAYELRVPPFVTTDPGDARTGRVPIEFVTHDGTPVRCGGYLDYHHLSKAQVKQLTAFVSDTNWSGFGQRHYDALPLSARTAKGQGADAAASSSLQDVVTMAQRHVPGLGYLKPDTAAISASMYSCTYPNGAPK